MNLLAERSWQSQALVSQRLHRTLVLLTELRAGKRCWDTSAIFQQRRLFSRLNGSFSQHPQK